MARPVIRIAIDPGFSSLKVICEGMMFSFPCDVIDNTGNENSFISEKRDKYAAVYAFGKSYLVGDYARKLLLEGNRQGKQELQKAVLNDYERFSSNYFEVSMLAALGIALVQFCELTEKKHMNPIIHVEDLKDCDIFLAIALPHAVFEQGKIGPGGLVKERMFKRHQFRLELAEKTYDLNFTIRQDVKYKLQSQVISALLGSIEDEFGEPLNIIDTSERAKPLLVIDGGYKTVGIFKLTKVDSVEDAESNPDFAMVKVDEEVAKIMGERGRKDIKAYNIQELYDSHEEIAVSDDGRTHYISLNAERDEKAEQYCKVMIDYLCDKYDNLLPIKQILITGGTGAAYYNTFVHYINTQPHTAHLQGHVKLAEYKFFGRTIDPMFAIVVGLYKQFIIYLDQNVLENEED